MSTIVWVIIILLVVVALGFFMASKKKKKGDQTVESSKSPEAHQAPKNEPRG